MSWASSFALGAGGSGAGSEERKEQKVTAEDLILEGVLQSEVPKCPENENHEVLTDDTNGIFVCKECALVLGKQIIHQGTEWRNFEDDGQRNKGDPDRIGGRETELLEDLGLSTVVGMGDATLAKTHNRATMQSNQRALLANFQKIGHLANRLSLPRNIIERAQEMYKRVEDSKEFKGRRTDALLAACIHVACKQQNVPRTFKEMCAVIEVKKRDLSRLVSRIKALRLYKKSSTGKAATSSDQLLDRFCSLLKLPQLVNRATVVIAQKLEKLQFAAGKHPATIAGAAIFIASRLSVHKRSLEQVAAISMMAAGTIKSLVQLVLDGTDNEKVSLHELLPAGYASKDAIDALTTPCKEHGPKDLVSKHLVVWCPIAEAS